MPGSFWLTRSEMFNITLYCVHTKPGEADLKLWLFKRSSVCMKTGSTTKCDTFDGEIRDK